MVPDSSANSLRRHCPDQVKGTPLSADLSLTAPLFLCPYKSIAHLVQKSSPGGTYLPRQAHRLYHNTAGGIRA